DTTALIKALKSGKISEAVIDCWENEPAIDRELLSLTAVATPHIAGFSADGKANGTRTCLENIERFFGVKIEKLREVMPSEPTDPVIDLAGVTEHRIEHAILKSFSPLGVDRALRETPEKFEWFRANYHHPREFAAYTVKNATTEERELFDKLGFK
ncbi:NAD(P)-dependent oxidoreductase, partial [Parabacteroides goldsteinii]